MSRADPGERLHRTAKLAMDVGEARTVHEAERILGEYRVGVSVGPEVATSATHQAALLTLVNAGRRCFLGGVEVFGDLGAKALAGWYRGLTLAEAVVRLGGKPVERLAPEVPLIALGSVPEAGERAFSIRATFHGWAAGVVPLADGARLPEQQECAPAGVLAGSLAVSEAFQHLRRDPRAGRRQVGLSLWNPDAGTSFLEGEPGPELAWLPKQAWLIGLGHLGQAYLWTLGMLPYADISEVELVLQDFDTLAVANESTQLLTSAPLLGRKKTRAMAELCEARGFQTRLIERRFGDNLRYAEGEPGLVLCGVDNPVARAELEAAGFPFVIEAGLGAGPDEYLALQIHTFPQSRAARSLWGGRASKAATAAVTQPAYLALLEEGQDPCGVTTLAGRSVGAAFVGAATSTLVVAEALRALHGGTRYELIDMSLEAPDARGALPASRPLPSAALSAVPASGKRAG